MKVLEVLSKNIVKKLKKINPESEVINDVLEYGVSLKLNFYGIILLVFTFGIIFNQLKESIIALLALSLVRKFSGGVHFYSLTKCMLATSFLCIIAPRILLSKLLILIFSLITLFIFIIRSPNWFEEFTNQTNHVLYKIISVLIVGSNFFIQSNTLSIIFLIQSLTLLPKGGDNFETDNS